MVNEPVAHVKNAYWENTQLADMTTEQWEALCDGCALCCMHKLEDDDTGRIAITSIHCEQLDVASCRCHNYTDRHQHVPDCIPLYASIVRDLHWLPETCAYRRIDAGKPLPYWHYLVSGDRNLVHRLGVSAQQFKPAVMPQEDSAWQASIIRWVD